MSYYAHSGEKNDKSDWQALVVHLRQVADLTKNFAQELGLGRLGQSIGQAHDLGKYASAFQERLEGRQMSVDHSTAGAKILCDLAQNRCEKFWAYIGAFCVLGHHAGLPDWDKIIPPVKGGRLSLKKRLATYENKQDFEKPSPEWKMEMKQADMEFNLHNLMPDFFPDIMKDSRRQGLHISLLVRLLFSCLIDADRRDTEAFYKERDGWMMDRDWPTLQSLLPNFLNAYEAHMAEFSNKKGELNQIRRDILQHVRSRALQEREFYTLTVPTGGGKTFASLGFALDHAQFCGHKRIIYTIPFTSVIEQTATIFKKILGEEHVLEHHSAFENVYYHKASQLQGEDGPHSAAEKLKTGMEDWGAPVIVTTNVQFFESLYADRPSAVRKLKNIANSVIILDEAQTIPHGLLGPCMRILDSLVRFFGCTIVFCTATQPAVDEACMDKLSKEIAGLPLSGKELAPNPKILWQKLRRATIRMVGEMDNNALVDAVSEISQALVIVNSRRHAYDLYFAAREAGLDGLIHLTTRQYAAHRRQILSKVREALKKGEPCRLIATSLVEAGVDIDFPVVWRAEAGLDQILQAAGRCNREGRHPVEDSVVSVFNAGEAYKPPHEIQSLIGDFKKLKLSEEGFFTPAAIEDYFSETYWRLGRRLDSKDILSRFKISAKGEPEFYFCRTAQDFRMIENTMVPVIIQHEKAACEAIALLHQEKIPSGFIARLLQPYIVLVPEQVRGNLIKYGHAEFYARDLRGDRFVVLKNDELYHKEVGLLWENAGSLTESQMFF